MTTTLRQTWDLECFFEGGSRSPALEAQMGALETDLNTLRSQVDGLASTDSWVAAVELLQSVQSRVIQLYSYTTCLIAQDVNDEPAKLLESRMTQLSANLQSVQNELDARMLATPEAQWEALLADPRLQPITFPLRERREIAANRMKPEQETLALDLAVNGYHGWGSLYSTLVGRITIPVDGAELSVGQAFNKFSEPSKPFRQELFARWEEAWGRQAPLISTALNNIAGFRLNLYRHRSWESVLKEPLQYNRMSYATLMAMWDAVNAAKPKLAEYLQRKAKVLGYSSIDWCDLEAPLGESTKKVSYEEAAAFIEENFRRFSPRMADFAARAFRNGVLEVEDRPGKAPGGFCTDFPESAESRIFMTYGGDTGGVSVLAHELGHGYHSHLMFDLPPMAQQYAMNVAETASTFAETITVNAAIASASSKEERLALLDEKLRSAVAYLMNIHARFIFETRFYDARRGGPLSVEELNGLMEQAQREAYTGALGTYHPLFWASKGHFYGTEVPFYNFPYTFGYLFSAGVFARAMEEGPSFEPKYVDLLRDTGRATVEDLARRHLGADLTKPDFWLTGVKLAMADVDEFLKLTQ